jgi:hypothetical protein
MIPIYECENREKRRTIHIEITNACNLACSNCTRFVGHHRKPYLMSLSEVTKSIESLVDFPGNIGIMGGEPTAHPDFLEIINILDKLIVDKSRRGLWTDGYKFKKYSNEISRVFLPENIVYNSHDDGIDDSHQPLLIHPADLSLTKEDHDEFVKECWIQKRWSASITPKGGFFCEVAAAQDMLFDGPGGYELTNNWWNKTPNEFNDQVERYCKNCSACIPLPKVSALDKFDYVSATNLKRLKEVASPKLSKNLVKEVTIDFYKNATDVNEKPWEHRKFEDCQMGDGVRYSNILTK